MPPEKFEKLNPLRLNLRAFLRVYCLDYSKAAHCKIIIVQLFGDYIISLRNCITSLAEGLHYHNKINLKGALLDMNHITTLRIQSMNIIIC